MKLSLHEEQRAPSGSARLAKRIRERILVHWPVGFAIFAIGNSIWEWAGTSNKNLALIVSIVFVILHIIRRLVKASTSRRALTVAFALVILFGIIVSVPLCIRAGQLRKPDSYFVCRVDTFLNRNYELCHSRYVSEPAYAKFKAFVRRPYYPELRDETHDYSHISAVFCHVDEFGVADVRCRGTAYPLGDSTLFFTCQGEAELEQHGGHLAVYDNRTGDRLQTSVKDLSPRGENIVWLGIVAVGDSFDVSKRACVPGAMTESIEGFVLDLQNFEHPPPRVDVRFFTNRRVRSVELRRLERNSTLLGWFLAQPIYTHTRVADAVRMDDDEMMEAVVRGLRARGVECNVNDVSGWTVGAPCHGGANSFVLKYEVVS